MAGFDRRVFLTEAEHSTYLKRMPVRYVKYKKSDTCCICGLHLDVPLENSHVIPFNSGIKVFKLTPDYLDRPENIKTAHRGRCNASVELSENEIVKILPAYDLTLTY